MMHSLLSIQRQEFVLAAKHLTILADKTSHRGKAFFALLLMDDNGNIMCMGMNSPADGTGERIHEAMEKILSEFKEASEKIVAVVSDSEKDKDNDFFNSFIIYRKNISIILSIAQLKANRLLIASLEELDENLSIDQGLVRIKTSALQYSGVNLTKSK